ncbi:MAG TPA: arsenate reductase ArsC [Candidatus Acidoferrales bacterium]|nr:arsenate reductase ArsC [Candidatus Acidoferrales bacterium]
MDKTPRVLFLSRGSASRAQIAEGFLRVLGGDRFIPLSAGTESADVSPLAMEVMSEVGIDLSTQRPREIPSLFRETFRCAVVVCDEPRERYPVYPFTRNVLKWSVSDPEVATGEPEVKKHLFRQVRDQIRTRVEEFIAETNQPDRAFANAQTEASPVEQHAALMN